MSDEVKSITFKNKVIIGLTGNIATGKSAVMHLAAEQGANTIDADKIVHELMNHDPNIQAAIAVAFGSDVRKENGSIDRKKLGEIVFSDANALKDLEAMIHPAVRQVVAERIQQSEAPIVVIEAIKLLEGDLKNACHQIWVTRCTKKRQMQRLMICRGWDAELSATRVKAQPPQEEKIAMADIVIDTNGLMAGTETQFFEAWARLPEPVTVAPKTLIVGRVGESLMRIARLAGKSDLKTMVAVASQIEKQVCPRPEGLQVRRAKPSDIPSILLLMQKATDGKVKMKRAELLMAFSERSYVIGQLGTEISVILGWSIDAQVARIDQMFVLPSDDTIPVLTAVLSEIEDSANVHIGEMVVAYIPENQLGTLFEFFAKEGYFEVELDILPDVWQVAIEESQPPDTKVMIRVLRDERLHKN
ncbi:MAG: dephospho-CoA kinase [Chloroflexi bacterium]|nr:MAG: dephospho-CoA kinase [Chloroflexota bacterium]PIE80521.1 MAG: dephospho-CoA kinase [Chloroflexota bacterium]